MSHPPRVDQGHAAAWLEERLDGTPAGRSPSAVVRTMVLQYLGAGEREHLSATMAKAGSQASPERPLIWIQFEWTPDPKRRGTAADLLAHRSGSVVLATWSPYGDWLEWRDLTSPAARSAKTPTIR